MIDKKILIVEDDKITQKLLINVLSKNGFDTLAVNNGREAIVNLEKFNPDLIITDVMMPEYSGLQLINFITKKFAQKIPILVISSLDKALMTEMASDLDTAGFISKPLDEKELLAQIQNAI